MPKFSYSQRQILINGIKIAIILIIFFAVVFWGLGWSLTDLIANKRWLNPQFITVTIALFFGVVVGIIEIKFLERVADMTDRIYRAMMNALKGDRGEKAVAASLRQILGEQYRVYPNFKLPEWKFDIDIVIVGPKGIITLEVKNIGGEFEFSGVDTYKITRYHNGNINYCWLNEWENPTKEAMRHNAALKEWLAQNGFKDARIGGALLMVGDTKIATLEHPSIYIITKLDRLKTYLDELPDNPAFTSDFCSKLAFLFKSE